MWSKALKTLKFLPFLFFLCKEVAFAKAPSKALGEVYKRLEEIKQLKAKDYFQKMEEHRDYLERYIEHKKRVCKGEFSTIILTEEKKEGERVPRPTPLFTEKRKHKLTKAEGRLCFRELKFIKIDFVKNAFLSRQRYLTYLHEKRIKDLKETRDQAIQDIHRSFVEVRGQASQKSHSFSKGKKR